uniref:Protein RFT1 homolog n=1 Tax=Parascaris equorum TaxID=6256 RepID=A0A914RZ95_PAREQ
MPLLQLLCLSGNVLNLLIYLLPYFDGSSSVHFLRAKAIANLVFVESRLFELLSITVTIHWQSS